MSSSHTELGSSPSMDQIWVLIRPILYEGSQPPVINTPREAIDAGIRSPKGRQSKCLPLSKPPTAAFMRPKDMGAPRRATFATVDAKSLLCHLRPGLHQSGLRRISVLSWTADLARVLALQALEVMKSCDDFDSTVSLESLATIRRRYSIPSEYVLPALGLGQCPCHPCPGGFNFSIDALEAGLRFPLHSVI
ncbi:hypothetical protein BHM03_00021814 [Ensete ventricosum]|nr:hypothetical protein BHM03_00021814 [Ensete ventricosum]